MRLAPSRALRLALVLALTAPLAACAAPLAATPPTTQARATGTVKLDLNGLAGGRRAGSAERKTLETTGYTVTTARLTVSAHDIETPIVQSVAWTATVGETVSAQPTSPINMTVPEGQNRVFLVEGLDANGKVLIRLRGAATVPANGVVTVRLNFLEDAVARVLEALMRQESPLLAQGDWIVRLRNFLTDVSQFDPEANKYAGMAPQRLRSEGVAAEMTSYGTAWLDDAESSDYGSMRNRFSQNYGSSKEIGAYSTFGFDTSNLDYSDYSVAVIGPATGGSWLGLESGSFNSDWQCDLWGLPPGKCTAVLIGPEGESVAYGEVEIREADLMLPQ